MFFFRYAQQRIDTLRESNLLTRRSRFANWRPVSFTEMEGLLSVIINMGLIQVPEIEAYWLTKWNSSIPFFSRVFSRDRFEQIFWMLHVGNIDPLHPNERINKVKPLLDLLIPNFQECLKPTCNISVDEAMVGFRGRFGPKQYNYA